MTRRLGVGRAICLLLLIATIYKLGVVFMPPAEISGKQGLGLPDFEEWKRGMAAHDWRAGSLLPWLDYQIGHFQGGTLLSIFFCSISFSLFGESPLTMRLANLPYDWATVTFLFLIVNRIASRRAAWVAGLLAALPMPGYVMVGSMVWASHVEANAFALGVLWLWLRHIAGPSTGLRSAFGLGVAAGLSLWFHYGLVMWFAVMLLVELIPDPKAWFRPRMGVRVLGTLVGLAPWWAYNLTHDWMGLGVYGKSAGAHFQVEAAEVSETFTRLITHFLPHSAYLPEWGGLGAILEVLFMVAVIAAWLLVAVQAIRRWRSGSLDAGLWLRLGLVLYPPVWTVLYTFGTFHGQDWWVTGYRYMLPLYPIAWIAAGLTVEAAMGSAWRRRTALTLVAAAVATAMAGTAHYLRPDHARINAESPGFFMESVGRFLFWRAGQDEAALLGAMERTLELRDPLEADVTLFTLANCLHFGASDLPSPSETDPARRAAKEEAAKAHAASRDALFAAAPERYRPYFAALRAGERPWKWPDRARFWAQWDRRGEGRPDGAYAH